MLTIQVPIVLMDSSKPNKTKKEIRTATGFDNDDEAFCCGGGGSGGGFRSCFGGGRKK